MVGYSIFDFAQDRSTRNTQRELLNIKKSVEASAGEEAAEASEGSNEYEISVQKGDKIKILKIYQTLHEMNPDMAGWLSIEGTSMDYPVMQTIENEEYYLKRDFYGKYNKNGSLIMDTDSQVGTGKASNGYAGGAAPSTNLIIHGHTIRTGDMFGSLKKYENETYGKEHNIICFDSLYEQREYELISVFYSQVYYQSDEVFKFYNFFQADTQEEFDDWYRNIKELSLYDTGVTAQFGDEFITLSTCSYHVEDGRFVIVGKRRK